MAPHTARHGAHRHSQGAVRTRTEQHVAPDATERVYEPATRRRKHATPEEIEYDIVVLFAERQSDLQQQGEDAYVCRTVRSIMHRAKFTSLSLSFSGVRGDALESIYASCPELRLLPTAVFSTEQAALLEEIVTILGPRMDMLRLDNVSGNTIVASDGQATDVKLNPASKITPQWFTMKNALNMVPADSGRPLIIMEDDVVLAEDFDTLLRAAILEAEHQHRSGNFALSLYRPSSDYAKISESGDATSLRVGPHGTKPDAIRKSYARTRRGQRGIVPLIERRYIMGQQAVVYSAHVLDAFRTFFAHCEHTIATTLRIMSEKNDGNGDGDGDGDASQAGASAVPGQTLCIEVTDNFNQRFVASMKNSMGFYTTMDSLVQHIGKLSAIQTGKGTVNQLFHYNVELGDVSEDYL